MKQFDLFGGFSKPTKSKVKIRNQGRPKSITPEIVFETKKLLSSKKKISNDEIMQSLNISKSTFYRIRKGDYDELFKKYINSTIQNFTLEKE
jgi:ACT domain-containing protein